MAPEAKVCNSGNFCPIFDPEKGTITEIFAYSHSEMISLKKMPQVSFLLLSECNSKKERGHVVGGAPPPLPPLLGLPRARWSHMPPLGPPPPHLPNHRNGGADGSALRAGRREGEEYIAAAHGTPFSLIVPATVISPPYLSASPCPLLPRSPPSRSPLTRTPGLSCKPAGRLTGRLTGPSRPQCDLPGGRRS